MNETTEATASAFPFADKWGGLSLLADLRDICARIEKLPGSQHATALGARVAGAAHGLQGLQKHDDFLWPTVPVLIQSGETPPEAGVQITDEAVEVAAPLVAEWIGYAWAGLGNRDISYEYADWAGGKMQGGKPACRRLVKRILKAALSAAPRTTMPAVPADVAALVVAARIVAYEDQSTAALRDLDKAVEAFAERVPWEYEPEVDDAPSEPAPSLVEAAEAMAAALRGYEQWEGDIILNGDWGAAGMAPTPRMTQAQWDQMIELQSKRNTALALYSTTSKEG